MEHTQAELEEAERHVTLGRAHIARQQQLILEFAVAGYPTALAVALLASFEGMQRLHEAHRDRLRAELHLPPAGDA
jgi:hypothetical protein